MNIIYRLLTIVLSLTLYTHVATSEHSNSNNPPQNNTPQSREPRISSSSGFSNFEQNEKTNGSRASSSPKKKPTSNQQLTEDGGFPGNPYW